MSQIESAGIPAARSDGSEIAKPSTTNVGGISVVVAPGQVIIGTQTVGDVGSVGKEGSNTKITQDGQTFTVSPSEIIGPGVVIPIPTRKGGVFIPTPTPTVIAGVSVQLELSTAIIAGSTYDIGGESPPQTVIVDGQTISVGSGGLGFAQTTVPPPAPVPTNVVILDGDMILAIGSSEAVIGGSTFFYGPSSSSQTDIFNGVTITIGPANISFGTSVLSGNEDSGTQLGIVGGVSVTEIGPSIAVIDELTFIVGPGAEPTTAIVEGKTISADPSGLSVGEAFLSYPFNQITQVTTAEGVTFSGIGSSLVDMGASTFTVESGAKITTNVFQGQTTSLGPGGIQTETTTMSATSGSSPTFSAKSTGEKNGVGDLRPYHGVLGICIAMGLGHNV